MQGAQLRRGNLVRDMGKLLESSEFTDISLQIGEKRFPAHRAVLAARSPVFAAMVHHSTQEAESGCIIIPDIEEEVLRELLCYIYTDKTTMIARFTEKLLIAANKYDIPLLKRKCEEKLIRKICITNVAALAVLAVISNCIKLKVLAIQYIKAYKDDVVNSDGWKEAQQTSPQIIAEICEELAAAVPGKRTASEMAALEDLELNLEYEAQYGTLEEVKKLVAAGVELDARSRKDRRRTALHVAAAEGREEIVKYLLEEGATADLKDADRMTPLLIAAGQGNGGIVSMLLQAGAEINVKDSDGCTPLLAASACGNIAAMHVLLAESADINARDKRGCTPLHCAAQCDEVEAANVLLAAGADRCAKNKKMKTPLDMVKRKDKQKWEDILRECP